MSLNKYKCCMCGNEDCDWMVTAKLVPEERAICGDCKQRIGGKIIEDVNKIVPREN